MITSLDIENFKCFSALRLSFGKLTLLTGFNGGGKSSAVQPLLLLAQGLTGLKAEQRLPLNGELVRLGTVGDITPSDSVQPTVTFRVEDGHQELSWTSAMIAGDRSLTISNATTRAKEEESGAENGVPTASDGLWKTLIGISYISATREGTLDAYPMPDVVDAKVVNVGVDGRFAAYWYDLHVDDEVLPDRRLPAEPATTLRKQLDACLSTLFPGSQANVQQLLHTPSVSLQFRLSDIGAWRRPANVGYGFTYAFPILVALLVATEGQVVIIDSPEAHLHPFAQSQMGRLLAHFAKAGVQIIVETHSDHLLNGVRLSVKDQTLAPEQVQIHFFTGPNAASHGVVSPVLDREGSLSTWPDGFFDQSEKDLGRLTGWD